jgi:dipeptidase E
VASSGEKRLSSAGGHRFEEMTNKAMRKIIAIGGGSIGFGAAKPEVMPISREIIRLSGKKSPRLLFIPTASSDDKAYARAVRNHFGGKLGCRVDSLFLLKHPPLPQEISKKIKNADIIYVGGGNTLMMINRWKKLGVDGLLRDAAQKGKVLCGPSAGAICWFRQGNSDSRKFLNPKAKLIKVAGLGFIDALACPHYDVEKDRKPGLKEMMKKTKGVAIAMDNCAALEVVGERYRTVTSKPPAGVYKVFWLKKKYFQEKLTHDKAWRPLSGLLEKPS